MTGPSLSELATRRDRIRQEQIAPRDLEDERRMHERVSSSFLLDDDRWTDSYVNHSTEAVRRRVLARLGS